jgi:hypothetical protein
MADGSENDYVPRFLQGLGNPVVVAGMNTFMSGGLTVRDISSASLESIDPPEGYIFASKFSDNQRLIIDRLNELPVTKINKSQIRALNRLLEYERQFIQFQSLMNPKVVDHIYCFIRQNIDDPILSVTIVNNRYKSLKHEILKSFIQDNPRIRISSMFRDKYQSHDVFDLWTDLDLSTRYSVYWYIKVWASNHLVPNTLFDSRVLPKDDLSFYFSLQDRVNSYLGSDIKAFTEGRFSTSELRDLALRKLKASILNKFARSHPSLSLSSAYRSHFCNKDFERLFSRKWPVDNTGLSEVEIIDKLFVSWSLAIDVITDQR